MVWNYKEKKSDTSKKYTVWGKKWIESKSEGDNSPYSNWIKIAPYKDAENFHYLELKTHNFVIIQDTAKNEVLD